MKSVNMHEAKTHLSQIVKEVEAGEHYVIGRAGKPVAKLIPIEEEKPIRTPGLLKGKMWVSDDETVDQEIAKLFDDSQLFPE